MLRESDDSRAFSRSAEVEALREILPRVLLRHGIEARDMSVRRDESLARAASPIAVQRPRGGVVCSKYRLSVRTRCT
jgi:hypothetical protein